MSERKSTILRQGSGDAQKTPQRQQDKADNPVFSPSSMQALITSIERLVPNFGLVFGMYLGLPTLTVLKLREKYVSATDGSRLGEILFRNWFNGRKRGSKESERYKEVFSALNDLDKPLFAEVFQQKFVDELPMKMEDFQMILYQEQNP